MNVGPNMGHLPKVFSGQNKINNCCAELEDRKIYLYFVSFIKTEMLWVVESILVEDKCPNAMHS